MDSEFYSEIIRTNLIPYCLEKYDLNCVLHQENDTKHNSLICRELLEQVGLQWVIKK
jgi:hypothetical protein